MTIHLFIKPGKDAARACCADGFYDNPKTDATLEKDIEFAINCLEDGTANPAVIAEAREAILRGGGVLSLMNSLAELYAEAGVAGVGLPRRMTAPHAAHIQIAKAIEHQSACDCAKKKAEDNDAATERMDYLLTPQTREVVLCPS